MFTSMLAAIESRQMIWCALRPYRHAGHKSTGTFIW